MNLKKHYNSVNYIIILMKYFIFGSKYRKEIPTFYSFKNYLLAKINIEREIAISKNKLNIHTQKWAFFNKTI